MKFNVEIIMGNAAMETAEQVADALEDISVRVRMAGITDKHGIIMDENGNRVGTWMFLEKD